MSDEKQKLMRFLKVFSKLVIIGCGNPMKGDDAVGVRIVEQLKKELRRTDVVCINAETVLENFIGKVIEAKPSHILIIDVVLADGREPGEWFLLEPEQMESGFYSTHSMPLSFFCHMVENGIGCSIMGLGIIAEELEYGTDISERVQKAIEEIVDMLRSIVQ